MNITVKQFNYLQEMGISLWQQKEKSDTVNEQHFFPVSIEFLTEPLVLDIARLFALSPAELSIHQGAIDFDLFNWRFAEVDQCRFEHQQLVTPPLTKITHSLVLKKQLWRVLAELLN
jgi:DNA polymerase III psi subunit